MFVAWTLKKTLAEAGEMPLEELALWLAFLRDHDPERRADLRAGVVAAQVRNKFSDSRLTAEDFYPGPKLDPKEQAAMEAEAAKKSDRMMELEMMAMTKRMGGQIKKGVK
jgi:hypothetical protein